MEPQNRATGIVRLRRDRGVRQPAGAATAHADPSASAAPGCRVRLHHPRLPLGCPLVSLHPGASRWLQTSFNSRRAAAADRASEAIAVGRFERCHLSDVRFPGYPDP